MKNKKMLPIDTTTKSLHQAKLDLTKLCGNGPNNNLTTFEKAIHILQENSDGHRMHVRIRKDGRLLINLEDFSDFENFISLTPEFVKYLKEILNEFYETK